MPFGPIILKGKTIIHNTIGSVGYSKEEIIRLITL